MEKKRLYSAKETYDFKEPTDRSHPIVGLMHRGTQWRKRAKPRVEEKTAFLDAACVGGSVCGRVKDRARERWGGGERSILMN